MTDITKLALFAFIGVPYMIALATVLATVACAVSTSCTF